MLYSEFNGLRISQLGFGAMRLPLRADGSVDQEQTTRMVRRAFDAGVNYFDTAYPYHNGQSETALGKALSALPRESYYLASKFPGHQIAPSSNGKLYDPQAIFEEQLRKCQVDHFDFYLLHNVYENSLPTYLDETLGIVDYFVRMRDEGRITYLGFSTHGQIPCMQEFMDAHGSKMDFCQIQLNYLDWTLQQGREKYQMLRDAGLPVIVMEPVRGGVLASLDEEAEAELKRLRPDRPIASWTFAWLQGLDVLTTLSGMTTMEQLEDNLSTYQEGIPLSTDERAAIEGIASRMANLLPCTACGYCLSGCPQQLKIPDLLKLANDVRFKPSFNVGMTLDALPATQRPEACTQCGACAAICPQGIDIPQELSSFASAMEGVPHWADLVRSREAAAQ